MTKEKDHREWFNYVIRSVNYIAFYDSAFKTMMTTIHDPIIKEHTYFNRAKRPGASLKYFKVIKFIESPSINSIEPIEPIEPIELPMGPIEPIKPPMEPSMEPIPSAGQICTRKDFMSWHSYF